MAALTKCALIATGLLALGAGGGAHAQPAALTPADYVEIYQLYAAYSLALDTGDGAGRAAVFTPDGTFSSDLSKHTPETVTAIAARTSSQPQRTHPVGGHLMTNILLTPTAKGAEGAAYALILSGPPDAQGALVGTPATYTDTLVRTTDGWRFKSREVWTAREGPTPLLSPPPPGAAQ